MHVFVMDRRESSFVKLPVVLYLYLHDRRERILLTQKRILFTLAIPHPLLIFSQSENLIQVVATNSHT